MPQYCCKTTNASKLIELKMTRTVLYQNTQHNKITICSRTVECWLLISVVAMCSEAQTGDMVL